MTILSFRCKQTKKLFEGKSVAKFANFRSIAERKLQMLDSAQSLNFLRSPAGNRLEALSADRKGHRICFVWTDLGPQDVEIVDYH